MATQFVDASMSANTATAYRKDWARFVAWCEARGHRPLPADPSVVASYLTDAACQPARTCFLGDRQAWRYSPSTLGRWVAGINKAHQYANLAVPGSHPQVKAILAGVRRSRNTPPARKVPLLIDDIEAVVAAIDTATWPRAPAGLRDRALLVMGWVGAFRRSELAGLTIGDVKLHPEDGLHVRIRRSKTDQEAAGAIRALPYARRRPTLCAPCAFVAWARVVFAWDGFDGGPGGRVGAMRAIKAANADPSERSAHVCGRAKLPELSPAFSERPLFRAIRPNGTIAGPITGHAVNSVVKRRAAMTAIDPADLGGHSLRAGFVTQAFRSGADAHSIMRQTGHRSPVMLEVYAREGAPLVGNAVTRLGL